VIPPELLSLELLDQPGRRTRRAAHLFRMGGIFLARGRHGNRLPFCDSSPHGAGAVPQSVPFFVPIVMLGSWMCACNNRWWRCLAGVRYARMACPFPSNYRVSTISAASKACRLAVEVKGPG
jgi:hypothetical protein